MPAGSLNLHPGLFVWSSSLSTSTVPRPGFQMDSATDKTCLVHQPEDRGGKQEADEHGQSGQKPDLLLMRRWCRLSPANALIRHSFFTYMPGNGIPPSGVHPIWIVLNSAARPGLRLLNCLSCLSDPLAGWAGKAKSSKRRRLHPSPTPKHRDCPQGLIQGRPKLDRFTNHKIAAAKRKPMTTDNAVQARICF